MTSESLWYQSMSGVGKPLTQQSNLRSSFVVTFVSLGASDTSGITVERKTHSLYLHVGTTLRLVDYSIINPRRACAARVTSVCLSVTTLAKALLSSTLRKRYVQNWYRLFSVLSSWIFEKTDNSYGVKKPIFILLTAASYGADAVLFRQNFRRDRAFSGSFKV